MEFEKFTFARVACNDVGPAPDDESYKGLSGRWRLPAGHPGPGPGPLTADALALPDVIVWGPGRMKK
jgi:hypothetical protein